MLDLSLSILFSLKPGLFVQNFSPFEIFFLAIIFVYKPYYGALSSASGLAPSGLHYLYPSFILDRTAAIYSIKKLTRACSIRTLIFLIRK